MLGEKSSTTKTGNRDRAIRRDKRLKRFARPLRKHIAALTCCAPEAEDLIDSYPALLVALVSPLTTAGQRQQAFKAILAGQPLKQIASLLNLPVWLRRMPAEAFREPIRHLPAEAEFQSKVANFIPAKASRTREWLEHVSRADEACGGAFALWVAKYCHDIAPSRRTPTLMLMAGWAWYARQPETTGYKLIDTAWTPRMGIRRANQAQTQWRRRAELACLIGDGIEDPWLQPGTVNGYAFVPLRTIEDFLNESSVMQNCLDQYGDRLGTGLIRVFSIRKQGRPVADIEVGPIPERGTPPMIIQIKARHNRAASSAVWQAAEVWLEGQELEGLRRRPGYVCFDDQAFKTFWQPYLEWLPHGRRGEFMDVLRTFRPPGSPNELADRVCNQLARGRRARARSL